MNPRHVIVAAVVAAAALFHPGVLLAQTRLSVMVFPGMANLPIFAAQANGFFARRGLAVDVAYAPNSDALRNGLADGKFQIVHAAVDNAVAMIAVAKADATIVIGGDSGFQEMFVTPEIGSYADIRGKPVLVDAPNTAFAFLLYGMLKKNGLDKSDYQIKPIGGTPLRLKGMEDKVGVTAMLMPPFSIQAAGAGLKSFGFAIRELGPYQATGGFVMRKWATANAETLVHYLQAYLDGLRWGLDPANKSAMIKLYADNLKLPDDVAEKTYEIAVTPGSGLAKDAQFDMDGFRRVLDLRAEFEGGAPQPPEKFLDMSYYDAALKGM